MNIDNLPLPEQLLYQKGIAALRKKNCDYALELFRGILKNYPDFNECKHYLWTTLREKRRDSKPGPLKLAAEIAEISFLTLRQFIYLAQGRLNQAIADQEKIVSLKPDNTTSLNRLAILFMRQNKTENAQMAWEEILLFDKKNIAALKQLAVLYFKNKDYENAKITAKFLLEIIPHNLEAENILKDISALGTIEKGFDNIKPAT